MATEQGSDQRPEDLTDDEILSLPLDSVPRSILTEIWARHATLQSARDFAQFNRELDDAYAGPRRFTAQTAADKRRGADRESREFVALQAHMRFQQTMEDLRNRTDDLLRRIGEQEQLAVERLAELRKRAIVLSDGRRVYVGDQGDYIDEDGRTLAAQDAAEARVQHAARPDAATWNEKTEADRQYEDVRRMKHDVLKFREKIGSEDGEGLSADELDALAKHHEDTLASYEARFDAEFEAAPPAVTDAATDYGSADYMAAYATSFASTLDPKQTGLKDDFRPAAAGGEQAPEPVAPKPIPGTLRGPSF